MYIYDWKLLGRNEDDLENEIKIVKAISIDINMNFVLERYARICSKKGRFQKAVVLGTEHILKKILILCVSYIATTE